MSNQRSAALQWLTFNRLVVAIVFIALFTMAIRYPADSDTWWHLLAGRVMIESKSLLTTDIFSHTKAGAPWINHGWLAQLFWYSLLATGGFTALSLGLAAIVTAAFGLVWLTAEGNLYVRAFGVILGAVASSIVWAARPQMISLLLTALTALMLHRFKRKGAKLLPWFPLVVLLWVNLHGGFAIAFILLICYAIGEAFNALTASAPSPTLPLSGRGREHPPLLREGLGEGETPTPSLSPVQWNQLLWTIAISLAVVAINPNTWRMWLYPFQTVGIGVLQDFIAEWQSPNFHRPILYPFLAMLLIVLAAFARGGRKVDWTDLTLTGAWLTLSLFAVRNTAVFAIVSAPILVRYTTLALEAQFGPLTIGRAKTLPKLFYILNWALLALIVLGATAQIAVTLSPKTMTETEKNLYPAEAAQYIQQNAPPGPLFNSYNIGGYLMYHLWPNYPVFVDGRTDLYDDKFLRRYLRAVNGLTGWDDTLDAYNIQLLVLGNNDPLPQMLENESGWQRVFEDEQVTIFSRR